MRKTLIILFLLFIAVPTNTSFAANEQSFCIRDQISFPGVEQRFLPLPGTACPAAMTQYGPHYCGRGPHCVSPTHIVMHTTHGALTAQQNYDYFAKGSGYNDSCPTGYCGTGSHFVIGKDGEMLQMIAMGRSQVEYGQAVGGFQPHISIEMGSPVINGNYSSKTDMLTRGSQREYESALQLVKTLMQTYNIPLERVVGHYNLAPGWAGDPGAGWMNDFKRDLASATGLPGGTQTGNTTSGTTGSTVTGGTKASACAVTKVGTPSAKQPICSGVGSVAVGGLPTTGSGGTQTGGGTQYSGNFIYYCQGDPKWSSICSLGNAGCGPTSVAMVVSSFGVNMTPPEVDSVFHTNGWRSCSGDGSLIGAAVESANNGWLRSLGFRLGPNLVGSNGLPNLQEAKKHLDQGWLIIANGHNYPCLGCQNPPPDGVGHIFVIDGVDVANNRMHTRDPNNCSYTTGQERPEKAWIDLDTDLIYGQSGRLTYMDIAYPIRR